MSQIDLTEKLNQLKDNLSQFPEDADSLEVELESAAKHIPAYVKIVKSHIEQLERVLKLDNHNNRTLETAELAEPVLQLMDLFNQLQDGDLELIEELARVAKHWTTVVTTEEQSSIEDQATA